MRKNYLAAGLAGLALWGSQGCMPHERDPSMMDFLVRQTTAKGEEIVIPGRLSTPDIWIMLVRERG
jgi:hypothetical protein